MRTLVFALFATASLGVAIPVPSAVATAQSRLPANVADELLSVDRAFSRASGSLTGVDGISAMFDDNVVLYAQPVPGFARGRDRARETLERAMGSGASTTQWTPIRVGVSADGEQGFTFGYMTTTLADGSARPAKYVSYWVRRPQGWRVVLFKRVPRAEGSIDTTLMPPSLPARLQDPSGARSNSASDQASLASREREFSHAAQSGIGPAFARFGRPDAVNVGAGPSFIVGAERIGEAQGPNPSPVRWAADEGVIVSASGDLGVTWGFLRRNGPTPPGRLSEVPFFTIWRRDNRGAPWLYVAE